MLTQEQIADFESRFPGCIHVKGPGDSWEVIVRPPSRPELKRYRSRLRDPRWAPDAIEELVTDAVVYPDRAGFQALLDRYGLLCEGISAVPAVADMIGLTANAASK